MSHDVAILGGGAAGIAAARRLHGSGLKTILLEALPRLGGRTHTIKFGDFPLDLGAGWLHSADRNPWVALSEQGGFTIDRAPPAWHRQFADLGFSREEQREAAEAYERFGERLRRELPPSDVAGDALEPGGRWNAYLDGISGALNGVSLGQVSARDFLAYEDPVTDGNWRVREGLGAAIAAALLPVEVRLGTPVTRIVHDGARLRLDTPAGPLECRAAIVTVATDVMASGRLGFAPALEGKAAAAAQLPLGHVEKLFLALDDADELEPDTHLIGDPQRSDTGHCYLRPFGYPVVEGFFGGAAADAVRAGGEAAAAETAIDELVHLLGSGWRRRLRRVGWSGWGEVPWIGGAYSHARPGEAEARTALAAPIEDRLFFAGEACSASDYSTVHGAYETGTRAAEAAIAHLSGGA
jgi:monoamine oxidase